MRFFAVLLVTMFFALIGEHFIGPLPPYGVRVLLMPMVVFYGALALPLPGMPDTCSSVGTVAKHSRCPPLRPCQVQFRREIKRRQRQRLQLPPAPRPFAADAVRFEERPQARIGERPPLEVAGHPAGDKSPPPPPPPHPPTFQPKGWGRRKEKRR